MATFVGCQRANAASENEAECQVVALGKDSRLQYLRSMNDNPFYYFATVNQTPINLSVQTLIMIVLHVCDAVPATAGTDAKLRCDVMMRGIGSVSKELRHLAKYALMGDGRPWLKVQGANVADCMACFPLALSLRIVGDARAGDIGAVLGSRSVMQLAIATNDGMRDCEGLGQLVGLRALHITECRRLRDVAALSSLVDLRTLHLTRCELRAGPLVPSLAAMSRLTSLDLAYNFIGAAGAASLAPSLALMAQLTSLSLGFNHIGAAGAASLAPSLAVMEQLTSLSLGCNANF